MAVMSTITETYDMTFGTAETIVVPSSFNGPRESGNGGYSAGLVAGLVDGPAEVRLRSPVPLETPLEVERRFDGNVLVSNGSALIATARPAPELRLPVLPPVTLEKARAAAARYQGSGYDLLSQCYVCGPDRGDSFGVCAAPVEGRAVVATPWTPPAWAADRMGEVRAEHVWAALDCPTYFGAYLAEPKALAMLAEMQVRIDAPLTAGTEYVVMAWPLETAGRKRYAASAVLTPAGDVLAVAKALLIELRTPGG
jgi:hypothetical protein